MKNFDEIVYVGPRSKDGKIDLMQTQSGEYVSLQLSWNDGRKTSDGKKSYTNINGVSFLKSVVDRFKPDQQGVTLIESGDRVRVQGELQSNNYTGQDGRTVYGYQVNISDIRLVEKRAGQTAQTTAQAAATTQPTGLPQPTGYVQPQGMQGAPVAPATPAVPQGMPAANQAAQPSGFTMPTMAPAAPQGMPTANQAAQPNGFAMPTMAPAAPQVVPSMASAAPQVVPSMASAAPQGGFTLPQAPNITPSIPTIQGVGGMPLQNMAV